ncbi:MAG: hypothetical protein K0U98_17455 [Deltaproteobacteria bacterium]|nr:hypothetical protein [Deltaproteobacteria bacterium]
MSRQRSASSPKQLHLFRAFFPKKVRRVSIRISTPVQKKIEAAAVSGTPRELWQRLSKLMDERLERLTLTDNLTRILSSRVAHGSSKGIHLRLHWCFLSADPLQLAEVAGFALGRFQGPRKHQALEILRQHFNDPKIRPPEPSPALRSKPRRQQVRLRPQGRVFPLNEIRDKINHSYFENRLTVPITWGRSPTRPIASRRRPRRRTIHFGTYNANQHLIRIHPVLDQPWVPLFVVESVVHHEMLHADLPAVYRNGRHRFHTPEFRRRERLFAKYQEAEAWLEENLALLLDSRERLGVEPRREKGKTPKKLETP